MESDHKMNIIDLAKQYNTFQRDVGAQLDTNVDETISLLFAKSFRKIANGSLLVTTRDDLKNQLFEVRQQAGKWTIDVKETLAFQDPQRCLIRYHLTSINFGSFDVMAILRANIKGLIEEIDEVYYQRVSLLSSPERPL